jgi:hypothetical protein
MLTKEMVDITEVEIIEESPRKVKIGNRHILIKQLTIKEYFWVIKSVIRLYLKHSAELINIYNAYKSIESEKSKLKAIGTYMVTLIKIDSFRKETMGILNKLFPVVGRHFPFAKSYLEKHATPNDIMQIMFGLYQYNIGDVKKNFNVLANEMNLRETQVSSNLRSTSSQPMAGEKDKPITAPSERSNGTSEKKIIQEVVI